MLLLRPLVQGAILTASFSYTIFSHSLPAIADTGFDSKTGTLAPCASDRNCVSSKYQEPPNRYISPLKIVKGREAAFAQAVRDLSGMTIVDISPNQYYIHLTLPGTAPNSLDDIEFVFLEDIVNVRCDARVTLPPPPFCIEKNCINGNMDQRRRVEKVARMLGLPYSDSDQMSKGAKWTPIFFNSDRVPGFNDDDEY